jgi:hypothetical protein
MGCRDVLLGRHVIAAQSSWRHRDHREHRGIRIGPMPPMVPMLSRPCRRRRTRFPQLDIRALTPGLVLTRPEGGGKWAATYPAAQNTGTSGSSPMPPMVSMRPSRSPAVENHAPTGLIARPIEGTALPGQKNIARFRQLLSVLVFHGTFLRRRGDIILHKPEAIAGRRVQLRLHACGSVSTLPRPVSFALVQQPRCGPARPLVLRQSSASAS